MTRQRWLHLGERLALPLDVISRRTAILGQTDTGKTSTAVVMVEEASKLGAAFVVLDPTDAWWGIASSADGSGPGVDCVVIGGAHGDVPIDEHAGRVVARLAADEGYSLVLCLKSLGSWSARQRFVADFLSELYEHAARQILLVVDEAHRFAPQQAREEGGHAARCMGAMIDVVLLGRRQGIGTVVVTQRTARLHKDVLEASEILIAHRLRGSNDRKALAGWVEDVGADLKTIMGEVGRAAKGVAHVSAPTLDVGGTFTIRPKQTFDSSKTIELGDVAVEPKARAKVDMAALEKHLAVTIEKQKANDPAELRKEISRLNTQVASLQQDKQADQDASYEAGYTQGYEKRGELEPEKVIEQVEVPVFNENEIEDLASALDALESERKRLGLAVTEIAGTVAELGVALEEAKLMRETVAEKLQTASSSPARAAVGDNGSTERAARPDGPPTPLSPPSPTRLPPAPLPDDWVPTGLALEILELYVAFSPQPVSVAKLGVLLAKSSNSGPFRKAVRSLLDTGYVADDRATSQAMAGTVGYRPSVPEIHERWRVRLRGDNALMQQIFEVVLTAAPDAVTPEKIGYVIGKSPNSGPVRKAFKQLDSLQVCVYDRSNGGSVVASPYLIDVSAP